MKTKIYHLIICQTCHSKLNQHELYSVWENKLYCEECFNHYLENIELASWESK